MTEPIRVLFLCPHNNARSQIAEGLLRYFGGEDFLAYSAGSDATAVHPCAVRAMAEARIDISGQYAKSIREFVGQHFDVVITVCDRLREPCPIFPGDAERVYWSFSDPAAITGTAHEQMEAFREVGRELAQRVRLFIAVQGRIRSQNPSKHAEEH